MLKRRLRRSPPSRRASRGQGSGVPAGKPGVGLPDQPAAHPPHSRSTAPSGGAEGKYAGRVRLSVWHGAGFYFRFPGITLPGEESPSEARLRVGRLARAINACQREEQSVQRLTQIHIDGSRLQGVDLSKVPNRKITLKKADRSKLNPFAASIAKASISTAANVSAAGQWAVIPQDFASGSLKASMVVPRPTFESAKAAPSSAKSPESLGVTIGLTTVVGLGLTMGGGIYAQSPPNEFGLIGALGFAGSISMGISVPVDILMVNGPIALLDGLGVMIVVDVGLGKTLFAGLGILCAFPSFLVIGYVVEFGAGESVGPPVTVSASLTYGGHIKLL